MLHGEKAIRKIPTAMIMQCPRRIRNDLSTTVTSSSQPPLASHSQHQTATKPPLPLPLTAYHYHQCLAKATTDPRSPLEARETSKVARRRTAPSSSERRRSCARGQSPPRRQCSRGRTATPRVPSASILYPTKPA